MGLVVAAYDPGSHVGGLFHALLPDTNSNLARAKDKPCMFLESGFETLQLALLASGAVATRLRYYSVGGAQVMGASTNLNIGLKNTDALQRLLAARGMKLTNLHLGGHTCRSFYLSIETGEASVLLSGQLNEIML
jgi:chemotaxis protein CheD